MKQKIKTADISEKNFPLWVVSIIFTVTTFIFFWEQISGNVYFWDDFMEYVFPNQDFAAREFANGTLPFWNPYMFSGMPFMADLQTGFFYPFNRLLSLFIGENGHVSSWAMQFVIILHFIIAQLSMYYLAKSWKISKYAALISSVSYAFSMMFVLHAMHPMIIYHLAWFPLVIMHFRKAVINQNIRNGIYAGLILGMSILSGHPQFTLYEFLFLGLLWIYFAAEKFMNKEETFNKINIFVAPIIAFAIAAGMFMIQYLPSKELAELSKRSEMTYEAASEGSLEYKQLYTMFIPKLFGSEDPQMKSEARYHLTYEVDGKEKVAQYNIYWESAFFFGNIAVFLALVAMFLMTKNKNVVFLMAISLFGILYSLGSNFILHKIFYNFPLFDSFRNPSRMMFFAVTGMSLLAGLGFDELFRKAKDKATNKRLLILVIIMGILGLIFVSGGISSLVNTPDKYLEVINSYAAKSFIFILLAAALILLAQRGLLKPLAASSLLVVLSFIDLYLAGSDFNTGKAKPEDYYTITNPQMTQMFKANPPSDLFRVNMRMYQPKQIISMRRSHGMFYGFQLIEGYNPLILDHVSTPCSREEKNKLMNVKYQIQWDNTQGAFFEEVKDRMPRAWMVHSSEVLDLETMKSNMQASGIDYRSKVLLEETPSMTLEANPTPANVEVLDYESNYIKLKVNNPKAGMMVLSEIWYPAWKAYVNNNQSKVYKANYSFRAVEIPAGEAIVEFKYESSAFATGSWITFLTLLLSLGYLGFDIINKRKNSIKVNN